MMLSKLSSRAYTHKHNPRLGAAAVKLDEVSFGLENRWGLTALVSSPSSCTASYAITSHRPHPVDN